MKRFFSLLLCLVMLMGLYGCGNKQVQIQDQVYFYYLRSDIQADTTFGDADSVIVPVLQESVNPKSNLSYLLKLYLTGPTDNRLYSPFPPDLNLLSVQLDHNILVITFNEALTKLSGIERTKACACLAMTCFNLTSASKVIIQTESETVENRISFTISRTDLVLEDYTDLTQDGGNS